MGSLGLVGEVFEVRAQVDRDLTTVSSFDRLLRLNKNQGRHNTVPSALESRQPRATTPETPWCRHRAAWCVQRHWDDPKAAHPASSPRHRQLHAVDTKQLDACSATRCPFKTTTSTEGPRTPQPVKDRLGDQRWEQMRDDKNFSDREPTKS
jgi:hypothetical protein